MRRKISSAIAGIAIITLPLIGAIGFGAMTASADPTAVPSSPPVTWCSTPATDPFTSAPAGSVTVPSGDNTSEPFFNNYSAVPNTTYYFAAGTHTLGTGVYATIWVADGDKFIGAPGAIIDGQSDNSYAFTAVDDNSSPTTTLEYLTVQHFEAGTGESVMPQGDYNGWHIVYNRVQDNPYGAGIGVEEHALVQNNCMQNNGEYGFNAGGAAPATGATFALNDIYDNNAAGYYDVAGSTVQCGCSGGGKFWDSSNVKVTSNYVHNNQGVGLWADTDNAGLLISGNYISNNWAAGIQYEASYNFQITYNNLIGNAVGEGVAQASPGMPDGAIYISESGSDTRVNTNYKTQAEVNDNQMTDNWGGVILWENADRYCSDGFDGTYCTLVAPATYTSTSCGANLSQMSPTDYYDNCRWKTQNVEVEGNTESLTLANLPAACATAGNLCGYNGLFSNYGTSIYGDTRVHAVTFAQNDVFADNTYTGPIKFEAWSQSNIDNPMPWSDWTAAVTDGCTTSGELASGTCNSGFGQDAGSSLTP